MNDENRKKYNIIFLHLQKIEIYRNYKDKCNNCLLEKNYFLTNKTWRKKYLEYLEEFDFDYSEFNEKYKFLPYDKAKNDDFLKELNKNGTPFKDMNFNLNNYIKEEEKIIKDKYEIKVPQNIELISEDYINTCMNANETPFGFEEVKIYIKEDTLLMVKNEIKDIIYICKIDNNEEYNFEFNIEIVGIIILEKIELDIIETQISALGINKYLENNKINKENEEIQNIINNKGEVIAKYIKYVKPNIDATEKKEENILKNEEDNIKIHNALFVEDNKLKNKNENNEEEESVSEKSNEEEEEEEEKEEDDI